MAYGESGHGAAGYGQAAGVRLTTSAGYGKSAHGETGYGQGASVAVSTTAGQAATLQQGQQFLSATAGTTTTTGRAAALTFAAWEVAGQFVAPTRLSVSPDRLSLTIDTASPSVWRQFSDAGDFSVQNGFGGRFRAVSDSAPTIDVTPGVDARPPIARGTTWLVAAYQEEPQGPARREITLDLQRPANRDEEYSTLSESGADYQLDVHRGSVALTGAQVRANPRQGTTAGDDTSVTLQLTGAQAAVLMDSWGHPDGVVERSVPDGQDFLSDESPDDRQTVTITAPADADLVDGDYLVRRWSLERTAHDATPWRLETTLHPQ